jgi:hypothetical protein
MSGLIIINIKDEVERKVPHIFHYQGDNPVFLEERHRWQLH